MLLEVSQAQRKIHLTVPVDRVTALLTETCLDVGKVVRVCALLTPAVPWYFEAHKDTYNVGN